MAVKKKEEFYSSVGSKYFTPIEYKYSEDDKCFIPAFGKPINRYEMIQASKPATDINIIVKRAIAGDLSGLNVRVPNYVDISNVPDNLNDLHAFNNMSIDSFKKLDPKIQKLFNNNVDNFIEAINNGSYQQIISNAISNERKVDNYEKKESDK